ncbi:hypothetical protein C2G38_2107546, partial [Gigaspora rosea]
MTYISLSSLYPAMYLLIASVQNAQCRTHWSNETFVYNLHRSLHIGKIELIWHLKCDILHGCINSIHNNVVVFR